MTGVVVAFLLHCAVRITTAKLRKVNNRTMILIIPAYTRCYMKNATSGFN